MDINFIVQTFAISCTIFLCTGNCAGDHVRVNFAEFCSVVLSTGTGTVLMHGNHDAATSFLKTVYSSTWPTLWTVDLQFRQKLLPCSISQKRTQAPQVSQHNGHAQDEQAEGCGEEAIKGRRRDGRLATKGMGDDYG